MKERIKNHMECMGYLLVIMLLLFGSVPMRGVLAETDQEDVVTEEETDEICLDAYLFQGDEAVVAVEKDRCVINNGTAMQVEYAISLEPYHTDEYTDQKPLRLMYTVYRADMLLQEGELELQNGVADSVCIEYPQTGEYTIEFRASGYMKQDEEYVWCEDRLLDTFLEKIEKVKIQYQTDIEKEGHFSYRED